MEFSKLRCDEAWSGQGQQFLPLALKFFTLDWITQESYRESARQQAHRTPVSPAARLLTVFSPGL
jgi:hypothetical protein